MAEIAAAAGLAKGTVFRYFDSKEETFVALLEDDFRLLFDRLGPLLASLPVAPAAAAKRFADGYCALLAGLPDISRAEGVAALTRRYGGDEDQIIATLCCTTCRKVPERMGRRVSKPPSVRAYSPWAKPAPTARLTPAARKHSGNFQNVAALAAPGAPPPPKPPQ